MSLSLYVDVPQLHLVNLLFGEAIGLLRHSLFAWPAQVGIAHICSNIVLDLGRQEVALDCRYASWGLRGDQIDAYHPPIRRCAIHGDLGP